MFRHLFSPVQIGSLQLKNRIVMPAVHLNYSHDGRVNDTLVNFYKERAKGGPGLIIVGGCAIDEVGASAKMVRVDDDSFLKGLHRLSAAVQKEGVCIAAQLYQAGRYARSAYTGKQPVAPSPIASRLTREKPRELSLIEIEKIIESYARAARLVQKAGFDAVEVLAGTGYLISQFLSPLTNQRRDNYGGSLENRMRFGLEVIQSIRSMVSPDFPLLVRVAGNDFMPGGSTQEEVKSFSRCLVQAGADCLNVTGGWHETRVPQATMSVPPGAFAYLAHNIKKEVRVPVIACNRINDPHLAETILCAGQADLVGMARPLIADADFPQKAQAGRTDEIRRCIGCNQGCLDRVFSQEPIACLVNPRVGREKETTIAPAANSRKILVIGGGPGGMEAARVAALRGHQVELWEKKSVLGGQLLLAAAPPARGDFRHLISFLSKELKRLGINVFLQKEAVGEKVRAGKFDVVVVATGAVGRDLPVSMDDSAPAVSAWEVLSGKVSAGKKVVVVGGGAVGVETALFLAAEGTISGDALRFFLVHKAEPLEELMALTSRGCKEVALVEMTGQVGTDFGLTTRWAKLADLRRFGVKVIKNAEVKEVTPTGVIISRKDGEEFLTADTVVAAVGSSPEQELYQELYQKGQKVYLIGDAVFPRKAMDAIKEAFDLALKL